MWVRLIPLRHASCLALELHASIVKQGSGVERNIQQVEVLSIPVKG